MGGGIFGSKPPRILCPTDFSEPSKHALQHAAALASAFDASITVYHVMPQTLMHPELFPYVKEPIFVPPEIVEDARDRLSSFAAEVDTGPVPVATRLEAGDAALRIVELAAELDVDLLALGSHGRGGFQRWMLGSVTDRLLRRAPCSVLTVRREPGRVPAGGALAYARILCAVDFSVLSLRALDAALELRERAGGELAVVHVVEPQLEKGRVGAEEARARLAARLPAEPLERGRLDVVVVEEGEPHREILREAEERAVDLVVAGVSGRGALDELLFGSTIDRIVRTVGCGVLSVRAKRPPHLSSGNTDG